MINAYNISKIIYIKYENFNYRLLNTYVFDWESDFLAFSKSEYCHEIEIKINKQDFNKDFNKLTTKGIKKHDILLDINKKYKPNKFYFACPEGLINKRDIPDEYGLYYIFGFNIKKIKEAKFLHKNNLLKENHILYQLMRKFYFRNIDLRYALELKEYDIKYNQKRLYEDIYY